MWHAVGQVKKEWFCFIFFYKINSTLCVQACELCLVFQCFYFFYFFISLY